MGSMCIWERAERRWAWPDAIFCWPGSGKDKVKRRLFRLSQIFPSSSFSTKSRNFTARLQSHTFNHRTFLKYSRFTTSTNAKMGNVRLPLLPPPPPAQIESAADNSQRREPKQHPSATARTKMLKSPSHNSRSMSRPRISSAIFASRLF